MWGGPPGPRPTPTSATLRTLEFGRKSRTWGSGAGEVARPTKVWTPLAACAVCGKKSRLCPLFCRLCEVFQITTLGSGFPKWRFLTAGAFVVEYKLNSLR